MFIYIQYIPRVYIVNLTNTDQNLHINFLVVVQTCRFYFLLLLLLLLFFLAFLAFGRESCFVVDINILS